jgi:hypothetical protein
MQRLKFLVKKSSRRRMVNENSSVVNTLVNVIALDLALHPSEEVASTLIPKSALQKLPQLLPNVTEMILDGVDLSEDRYSDYRLGDKMQNLRRIVWV